MTGFAAPALDAWSREDDGFTPLPHDWIEQPVGAVFDRVAARHPERLAISDGVRRWSYGELAGRVAGLATRLGEALPHASPVGLAFPSDARMPAAMLAALKEGLTYIPIDLSFPAERSRAILRHSGAAAVLTAAEFRRHVEEMADGLPVLMWEDAPAAQIAPAQIAPGQIVPGRGGPGRGGPGDVAYVLYTSGSTGRPKGVYQNQRNLLHDVLQYVNSIHLTAEDRLTLLYSPSVNGAIRDIYGALLTGASLHAVDLRREGLARVADTLHRERITVYHSMPPVLRAFLGGLPAGTVFDGVRMVYLAGDRLFRSDVELCRRHFPARSRIYAGLGSTENATIFRQWFIERDTPLNGDPVPVGYPVEGRPSRLVSDDGREVAPGRIGEIVVSSRHMALGYWKEPALTRDAFRPCPDDPWARRFHTGDLGREEADGLLHFLGRKDRQVKIRGYRIEPAEVEATLRQCPSVLDAAVVAAEADGEARLVAFVVPRGEGPGPAACDPAAWLAGRLPPHMRPERIVPLAAIPTLANFKPNHEELAALARVGRPDAADGLPVHLGAVHLGDSSPEAVALGRVWNRLLCPGSFERDDRFGDAGGESLRGLKLLLALEQALGRPLSPGILSMTTRPSELLSRLRGDVGLGPGRPGPVAILLPGILSADVSTIAFAERLRRSMTIEIIDYRDGGDDLRGALTQEGLFAHIRAVVDRHGRPERLWLLGFSFGAKIAAEAARRLESDGIAVELVAAIDGGPDTDRRTPARPPLAARAADWLARKWRHWRRGTLIAAAVQSVGIRVAVALAKAERFAPLRVWLDGLARSGFGDAHLQARRQALRHIRQRRLGSCAKHGIEREIVLFSTGDPLYGRGRAPDLGWSRLCPRVRIVPVGGAHLHALAPENHGALVAALERLIRDPAALAELER